MFEKKAVNVDLLDDKAQITVVNNEKMYKLLKMVTYRASKKTALSDSKIKSETLLEINE